MMLSRPKFRGYTRRGGKGRVPFLDFFLLFLRFTFVSFERPELTVDVVEEAAAVFGANAAVVAVVVVVVGADVAAVD